VVPLQGEPWRRVVELRVEDHPEPLAELRRLLDLSDAYALATEGDDLVGEGRHPEAAERYRQAAELAPDSQELLFWAGLALAQGGEVEEGAAKVKRAIELHAGWRDLLARLDPEIAPGAEPVRRALEIRRSGG
jgi:predicted Zn-dependent protease